MSKEFLINEGGLIGSGEGTVQTQSPDFQGLQAKILEHSQQRSLLAKLEDRLLGVQFQMEDYLAQSSTDKVVPPGAYLKTCIEILGIRKKIFANYLGLEESNLSDLLAGRRKISPEFALTLGEIFNIPPKLWLDIQYKNELQTVSESRLLGKRQYGLNDLLTSAGRPLVVS